MLDTALAATAADRSGGRKHEPGEGKSDFRRYVWQRRWFQTMLAVLVVFLVLSFVLPGVLGLLYEVRSVLVPVLIGLALAYIANPLLRWAHRRLRIGRLAGTICLMLLALVVVAAVMPPAIGLLQKQGGDLIRNVRDGYPRYVDKLLATLDTAQPAEEAAPVAGDPAAVGNQATPVTVPDLGTSPPPATAPSPPLAADPPADAQPDPPVSPDAEPVPPATTADPLAPVTEDFELGVDAADDETLVEAVVDKIIDPNRNRQLLEMAADRLRQLDGSVIANWAMQSLDIGVGLVGSAIGFTSYLLLATVIIAFCFFFFSWKFDAVLIWFKPYIPESSRAHTLDMLRQMDLAVSSFVRGRLIQSLAMMLLLIFGWYLVGVPYWFLLGVLTGVLNVVPFLPMVGWIVAVLLTVMTAVAGGGDPAGTGQGFTFGLILWPTVVYFIAQGLDGWLIEPVVQGKATNLDPLTVMLVVLIGGALLGLAGMLLAIPLAACLKILMREMVLPKLKLMAAAN